MEDELLKKIKTRKRHTAIAVAVVCVLVVSFVLGATVFRPGGKEGKKDGSSGTITMTIECRSLQENMDMLKEKSMAKYIPEDGIILDKTEYSFNGDATVFDALVDLGEKNGIAIDSKKSTGNSGVYIKGIGNIYEFDAGKLSGWLYEVDGKQPDYSCSKYKLMDGADIRWYYTVDYTKEE